MKKTAFALALPLFFVACSEQEQPSPEKLIVNKSIPIPAEVYENMADEKEFEERRDGYFDLIHSSSEDIDWRAVNKANFKHLAEKRALQLQSRAVETFADGELEGEWFERGSKDVPGNIRICDFQPSTEDIYVISDGGILWQGNIDGETWIPLNDGIQFDRRVIKVVDLPEGDTRIIAAIGYGLQFSDDNGETWTPSTGLAGSNGSGINLVQLNDPNKTLVYLYNRVSPIDGSSRNKIAYSIDNGVSFTFVSDLNSFNSRFASMDVAHDGSVAYIFDNNDDLYQFEGTTLTEITEGLGLDGSSRCMIQANDADGLTLYVLMDNQRLYKSTDDGITFDLVSTLPTSAWDVGFQVAIDDPDVLYYGEVNLLRSSDGGANWELVSEWWEYYDDILNKIHADIMAIEPFKKVDGTEFTLIPNHGGISISYDNLLTTVNIALEDLNTGQFYDVLTDPSNPALIYGGTQDQGFQRTLTGDTPEASSFEQVISGDYGQMQFTNNAENIWIQYPGADFQLYLEAETDGGYDHGFNVNGAHMPNYNWIVPTGSAPNPSDDFIYVGGGNLSGGSGSHLIKLSIGDGFIESSQSDFDFRDASGASISAIETTPLNPEVIYVVTENGRFFYSEDTGDSFTMTEDYIGPSGGWIYTADIYASRLTPGLLFVGGSGYAGSSVYMSTDSARSFVALDGDMPNTLVHEMVMDPNEKFLFAATDAGPYVYSMESEEWYNISGISAPIQQYMSVEYVYGNIVRFATWGRGIWDFDISTTAGINENETSPLFSLFPNPSIDGNINLTTTAEADLFVFDLKGQQVATQKLSIGQNKLNFSHLVKGTYIVTVKTIADEIYSEKLVIGL